MVDFTPELIEQVRERRKNGETIQGIAEDLGIPHSTLWYHLDEDYKQHKRDLEKKKSKEYKLSDEQKEKRRKYFNEYFKNRYQQDPEFRKKHIERVIKRQKETYQYKKKKNG